jgi:hypothetical protein
MYSTPIGAIACLAAACALTASGAAHAQTPDPKLQREALLRALETLLATGDPEHTTHDTGEWLQLAVDDAIVRGDIDSWNPDPTPDDACAFRIMNPRAAPPRYAEWLRDQAGSCPGK